MENFLKFTIAVFAVFIFVADQSSLAQQQPRISLFNSTNCNGTAFRANITNTQTVARPPTTNVFILSASLNGLWRIQPCNTTTGNNCNFTTTVPFYSVNSTCLPSSALPGFSNISYIHLTQFGDASQTARAVHFYTGDKLDGTLRTFTTNSTSVNATYNSYFYTGTQSWTVYSLPNFNGTVLCLNPESGTVSRGWGLSLVRKAIRVGSIRTGCHVPGGGGGGSSSSTFKFSGILLVAMSIISIIKHIF